MRIMSFPGWYENSNTIGSIGENFESRAKKEQRIELSHLAKSQYLLSIEAMGKIYSYKLLNFKTPAND